MDHPKDWPPFCLVLGLFLTHPQVIGPRVQSIPQGRNIERFLASNDVWQLIKAMMVG